MADLKWTGKFRVAGGQKLGGDKLNLPQSALEQLLSASTVTVLPDRNADEFVGESWGLERQQSLPHPLTFRLVSSGNVVYAGIREFSAEDGEVTLAPFLQKALAIEGDDEVVVHFEQLPKGTYVKFRPLEAGYDPEDWKALLERQLRNNFTTLTKGEVVGIQSGAEEFRFLIDEIKPEANAICIVDTDLEVDIEALNEEQARQTLQKRLAKKEEGGDLTVDRPVSGQVLAGEYVDYTLKEWDRSDVLTIELDSSAELFVAAFSPRQRKRPREDEHVFADVSEQQPKRVRLQPTNAELEGAESLYIAVRGIEKAPYSLIVKRGETEVLEDKKGREGEAQCKNCKQWVPERTMMLHENFCFRNNVLCPKCGNVYQKSSDDWKSHWHCPHDDAYGSRFEERHGQFFHQPATCTRCAYQARSIADLARHRTSTCPEKIILCQFCHLLVPQQGPDDLDPNDPEVILSGLTPHELSDGSSTTECHMCGKITRLRDMKTHLRHHELDRLSRPAPRLCRNIHCGRTLDGVGPNGAIRRKQIDNPLFLCDSCFGPLYNSGFDPENKALRRRVERRYLTQFLSGCGKPWCRNLHCKTGRASEGEPVLASKDAMALIKPILADMLHPDAPLHFCVDETSQKRRRLAEVMSEEYDVPWCVAALEVEPNMDRAREWLGMWAQKRDEIDHFN